MSKHTQIKAPFFNEEQRKRSGENHAKKILCRWKKGRSASRPKNHGYAASNTPTQWRAKIAPFQNTTNPDPSRRCEFSLWTIIFYSFDEQDTSVIWYIVNKRAWKSWQPNCNLGDLFNATLFYPRLPLICFLDALKDTEWSSVRHDGSHLQEVSYR